MHLAVYDGNPVSSLMIDGTYDTCKLLIEQGAKVDVRNHANMTPGDVAQLNGWGGISNLLKVQTASTASGEKDNPNRSSKTGSRVMPWFKSPHKWLFAGLAIGITLFAAAFYLKKIDRKKKAPRSAPASGN